jgi:hypothetical protein
MLFSSLIFKYIEKRNKEKLRFEEKFFSPDDSSYSDNDGDEYGEKKLKVNMADLRLIQISDLEKGIELGRGAFGTVYKGYYLAIDKNGNNIRVEVAIKELNKCRVSDDEKGYAELTKEVINVRILTNSKRKIFF